MLPVGAGSDLPGDGRVQAVGAHDDPGPQRRFRRLPMMAPHAHRPALGPQHVPDRKALDQLGARFRRGLGEQCVEHGPPGTVRVGHAFHGGPDAAYPYRADVEGDLADRRAAAARSRPSSPQACSRAPPRCHKKWVDMVSLGNDARSARATRCPARASSMANGAPAHRAPTTMTSYIAPPRGTADG